MNVLAYVHLRNICRSTGAGRVAKNLVEGLLAPDVNVRILADRGDFAALPTTIGQPWSSFRYTLFDRDTSLQQAQWLLVRQPNASMYWPDADVTFCTAESFVPKGRSRLAVTAHDAAYFEAGVHPISSATTRQRWKWRLLFSVLGKHADVIHTVSQFSADRLVHFFPALRGRIRVVHNAVTTAFFEAPTPDSLRFLRRHHLEGRRYVHVPGGLSFRKNAPLILETWPSIARAVPGLRLVVSGHVAPEYRAAAERYADSVTLAGFISDDELKRLYHHAELTWFPSTYEGFGLPVIESMACGTPIVSTAVSAIPEVSGGHALLLPVRDARAHRDAIVDLLADDRRRADMRVAGCAHASTFTWSRAGAQLAQTLRALL